MTDQPHDARESYVAFQQRRGRLPDLIEEAIGIYNNFMLDDDYNTQGALDKIAAKLTSARDWYDETASTLPNQGGVEELKRLAREDADHLGRVADEADENGWMDWAPSMRQAADSILKLLAAITPSIEREAAPIPMALLCPICHVQHVDEPNPEIGWTDPPHKSHLCLSCGCIWRPADVPTRGVLAIQTAGKADTFDPTTPPTATEAHAKGRDEGLAVERLRDDLKHAADAQVATCEACQAPLFDGDDYVADMDSVAGCWAAMTDLPSKRDRPCYAYRVGKPEASTAIRSQVGKQPIEGEGWLDIASAPIGENVLLFVPAANDRKGPIHLGRRTNTMNSVIWVIGGQFGFDVGEPTHWRPLPAPPLSADQERG